jgi:scyllo-inositol 2-dehydrogenase (NADP+)
MLPLTNAECIEAPELSGELVTFTSGALERRRIPSPRGNYGQWYETLARAIGAGDQRELQVSPEQARDVIRLIELAWISVRERRTVDVTDGELLAGWVHTVN